VRYVLIGSGNITRTYAAAMAHLPGSQLLACVSRSGRSPASAPDIECRSRLSDIESPFDAVIVVTPNGLHHEGVLEAARLGKHVLVEKPLDITREAMARMIDACDAAGCMLAVAYQHRAHPDSMAIKRLLQAGALGQIYGADLSCKIWRDQAYYDSADYRGGWAIDGGGPFMQQACHNIDLYQWFFGMPEQVTSQLGTFAHRIEAEDHGAALLRYADGMIGTIVASTCARPALPARLEVVCEKGVFVTHDDRITLWEIDGIPHPGEGGEAPKVSENVPTLSNPGPHAAILLDFETAIREGRPPLADAHSAAQTTELILRIYGR